MRNRDIGDFVARIIARNAMDNPSAAQRYAELLQASDRKGRATREAPSAVTPDRLIALARSADRAVLETIVSQERPVYFATKAAAPDGPMGFDVAKVALMGPEAEKLDAELKAAADRINPVIARIGRIDVEGMASMPFAGTGWLIDDGIIVTNAHVASVIGKQSGRRYAFRIGASGRPLSIEWNTGHFEADPEGGFSAAISEILYIAPEGGPHDIAFLKLAASDIGGTLAPLPIATTPAASGDLVCAIGYPARAPKRIIPDQELMKALFLGVYDVKRLAPGLVETNGPDLLTHDCTTLGGNSGSAVVSLKQGRVEALHFAGVYKSENHAVPAAVLADYKARRRWTQPPLIETSPRPVAAAPGGSGPAVVTITISVNGGQIGQQPIVAVQGGAVPGASPAGDVESAVCGFLDQRQNGVIAARVGYDERDGRIGGDPFIAVSVQPNRLYDLQTSGPQSFNGFPVRYEAATLSEQVEAEPALEAANIIAYDDEARTGPEFSFAPVKEHMSIRAHLSPEYGLDELEGFLTKGDIKRYDSGIYEFKGTVIAEFVKARLEAGAVMHLCIDNASLPKTDAHGTAKEGPHDELEFDTVETFAEWVKDYDGRFTFVKVPEGRSGLIKNSYHIKVTVRDDDVFWLSSGNWKNTSSQPLVSDRERERALEDDLPGNRDWHIIVRSKTLSGRFRSHLRQDFARSRALIADRESVLPAFDVIAPAVVERPVEERRPPSRILQPLVLDDVFKITPLLTPDQEGRVFTDAVLKLIGSAKHQLWFQIPYIGMRADPRVHRGNIDELIDALVGKLKTLDDARLILRTGNSALSDNRHVAWYLKSKGVDIDDCLRQLDDTHTKGMVVDGERVLIGSHNWSGDGVSFNRDASLVIEDARVAAYYGDAFLIDWQRANPVKAKRFVKEMPVLVPASAAAEETPGSSRMSLGRYLAMLDD
ncbi:phospholipase D-like domain-containing protein [Phreatobacter oligotrophus]|uniref:Phospholipase D n=1 Tax=Phreatobacter oligotrophus TaxID=1122261 RepID=A0A2T4YY72_9HYPH|nr:phospholipase D-like domain-containing protein [Phreatobacter oligotrophus]PTM51499.1 phospholipase D-like protein [Phreatobacter oligotrophus]